MYSHQIPRREQVGHRRPGTGRRTTPSKSTFGAMPDGPLSQGMAAVHGSARREMFERRPGTGRMTTPGRFDSIHESAMKNRNGRLTKMTDRSFGADMTNGSYRASRMSGYPKQTMYQPPAMVYQQPQPQVVYQQPQPVVLQQPMMYPQPQPVQYIAEPSHYAQEPSYTITSKQPARNIRSKHGTGREVARGRFNFKISAKSREAARRNMARKQASEQSAIHAEMQAAQHSMRIQQSMHAAVTGHMGHHDASMDYSDEDDMAMTVRPPPPGTVEMMDGQYDDSYRSRRHHSRRTRHHRDNEESRRRPESRTAPYEQHYPPAARESSYASPQSVDFSNNDNGADVSVENSAAESSVASSEAETEQETTIDPEEAAERQRLEEEERKAWEKNPAEEIAELEKQHQEEEATEQVSFDQEPDMGGMDDNMGDVGGGTEYYDDEDDVEIVQPVEKTKKKDKHKAKKKAPKRKANYEYVPVEQPQKYVITPPAEPDEGEQTPGCRRSRRRKMSPLAWWKGESVQYTRRMSAAYLEVKAIQKCPDAITPYKRRRVSDDAPLAICDRTVDSSDAVSVADTDSGSP